MVIFIGNSPYYGAKVVGLPSGNGGLLWGLTNNNADLIVIFHGDSYREFTNPNGGIFLGHSLW